VEGGNRSTMRDYDDLLFPIIAEKKSVGMPKKAFE
jgi:hypothetical protein